VTGLAASPGIGRRATQRPAVFAMSFAKSACAVGSKTALHLVAQRLQRAHGTNHDLELDDLARLVEPNQIDALELAIATRALNSSTTSVPSALASSR
jgi:hypothetical protein